MSDATELLPTALGAEERFGVLEMRLAQMASAMMEALAGRVETMILAPRNSGTRGDDRGDAEAGNIDLAALPLGDESLETYGGTRSLGRVHFMSNWTVGTMIMDTGAGVTCVTTTSAARAKLGVREMLLALRDRRVADGKD